MPYRAELKRPDLKGTFRCSICLKIFCHSSSLSRHRMQAHFKSYTCTLCNKEITSNETLRAHMYKQHQISRMFMCRCCNWAFPDKTSLHLHMQSTGGVKSKVVNASVSSLAASHQHQQQAPVFSTASYTDTSKTFTNTSPSAPLPVFSQPPGGIFPFLASRDDLMQRFRERIAFNGAGALGNTAAGLNLAALFANFPRVDASGVGSLGGSLLLQDDGGGGGGSLGIPQQPQQPLAPSSAAEHVAMDAEQHKNDNDETVDPISVDDDVDTVGHIASPDSGGVDGGSGNRSGSFTSATTNNDDEHTDGGGATMHHHQPSDAGNMLAECKQEQPDETREGEVTSSRSPDNDGGLVSAARPPSDIAIKRAQLLANLINASRLQFCGLPGAGLVPDSPLLRSAINSQSASPLNSLLYRKKLESAIKRNSFSTGSDSGVGGSGGLMGDAKGSEDVSPAESHSSFAGHSPPSDTSAGANGGVGGGTPHGDCFECRLAKGKLSMTENRGRFLQAKIQSLTAETSRLEGVVAGLEAALRNVDAESRHVRVRNEALQAKLLECQEKALLFMQNNHADDSLHAVHYFFTDILRITSLAA